MQTYIAEITRLNDAHRVRLKKPSNQYSSIEFEAAFDSAAALTVNGQPTTLGDLSRKLIEYGEADLREVFSERGQFDIGRYLFGQLFGGLKDDERARLPETEIDLRIVTEDEAAARLPWSLLYEDRQFLAATGWTVSLASPPTGWKNVELPPSPRILMVMPQPAAPWQRTKAEDHFQELERMLRNVNSLHVRGGDHLIVVDTLEDFHEQLRRARPHILYFYGHGDSDTTNSKLIFASRDTGAPVTMSAAELANLLRSLGADAPRMAYINCCLGDAGGLLGVGRQLGGVVPAVITNCTLAEVETAQAQAADIWRSVLLDGLPPHSAVAAMRKNLAGQRAGGLSDARWLAPIVHCGYDNWEFKPPHSYKKSWLDPNWEHTLDRIVPTGVAMLLTGKMIQNAKPRALAFVWYGKEFQGVEEFYKRLEIEIQNQFKDIGLYSPKMPEFRTEFNEFERTVSDALTEAFEEDSFDKVADKIRIEANNTGKRRTILYLRHTPIKKPMELYKKSQLKRYLEWLDARFVSRLSPHIFTVIGLPFITEDPAKFNQALRSRFDGARYKNLMLRVLNELGKIEYEDLDNFFDMHDLHLPTDRREKILVHIMTKTGGQYSSALEELKLLQQTGAWDYERENLEPNDGGFFDDEED